MTLRKALCANKTDTSWLARVHFYPSPVVLGCTCLGLVSPACCVVILGRKKEELALSVEVGWTNR